jgi:hypothetical protein
LKALLKNRFGGRPAAEMALAEHETEPEIWKAPLEQALVQSGADTDAAVLEAARRLQQLATAELTSVSASGHNARAIGRVEGDVAMDSAAVVKPVFGNVSDSAIGVGGRDVSNLSVTNTAASAQALEALFEPILADLRTRPANPAMPNAQLQQKVRAIRDEAGKGDAASPVRVASWLGELGAFAPDLRGMVGDALRQAGGAVSDAVRQAVEQVTGTGGQRDAID